MESVSVGSEAERGGVGGRVGWMEGGDIGASTVISGAGVGAGACDCVDAGGIALSL